MGSKGKIGLFQTKLFFNPKLRITTIVKCSIGGLLTKLAELIPPIPKKLEVVVCFWPLDFFFCPCPSNPSVTE